MADGSPLTPDRLRQLVANRDVDTVIVAFADTRGRLQGTRVHAEHFVDHVLARGTGAAAVLLAGDGAAADPAGGDLVLRPDPTTLRAVPWQPATALVLCDVWRGDAPVPHAPRQVLHAQVRRVAELGYVALAASGLQFTVFDETDEQARAAGYRGLTRAGRSGDDASLLGSGRVEPLLHDLWTAMGGAGAVVESVRGGGGGRHELVLRHDGVLAAADQHTLLRAAAPQIAAGHGRSLTFMARYDEGEGNACHLRLSLRGADGAPVLAAGASGRSRLFEQVLAGILGTMREFTLLYAPTVNSYKRYVPGGTAPTVVAWGDDNRTCAVRVVGTGARLRLENRVPGADVNPYLALAAMLAGALHGIATDLRLERACAGDAHQAERTRLPRSLGEAREEFASSQIARQAFGDAVVDHYVGAAGTELAAFAGAVTDWERRRAFERL